MRGTIQVPVWLALIALAWLLYGSIQTYRKNQRVQELKEAFATADSIADARQRELVLVRVEKAAELDAQRKELLDSIGRIPRWRPTGLADRVEAAADTIETIPAAFLEMVDSLVVESRVKDERIAALELHIEGEPGRMAARDSLWIAQLVAADSVIVARSRAQEALEAALAASEGRGPDLLLSIVCGAGGAAVGSLLDPQLAGMAVGALAGREVCRLF